MIEANKTEPIEQTTTLTGIPKKTIILVIVVLFLISLNVAFMVYKHQQGKNAPKEPTLPTILNKTTQNWDTFTNLYGYQIKHPKNYSFLSNEKNGTASISASVRLFENNSNGTIMHIIVIDKKINDLENSDLKKLADLDYRLNASSSANIKTITPLLRILIFGKDGYEYYIDSDIYTGLANKLPIKQGRNKVMLFENSNKLYIIITRFDETTESILDTLQPQ